MPAIHVIVVYGDLLAPGGVPYETRALIGGLTANGAKVTALCDRQDHGGVGAAAPTIITDFDRGDDFAPPTVMRYGLRSVTKMLRSEDARSTVFFLVGCRRPEYIAYARLIRLFGFRSIVFAHGLLAPELLIRGWDGRPKRWLRRQLEHAFQFLVDRPMLRSATMSRALSATEAARLSSLGSTRVLESADGVDRSWLASDLPASSAPRGHLKLLYLGRPEPFQKGLDVLLLAIDTLEDPDTVELILAGPNEDRFQSLVRETLQRIPNWVKVVGMVSGQAKWQLMDEAHFLVHVSRFEGMAKCVREAFGRGLPVLASYESNFGDWVRSTGAGLTTSATVEAVRDTVLRAALVTPLEREAMRQAARLFAIDHSWEKVAARLLSAIVLPNPEPLSSMPDNFDAGTSKRKP